MKTIFISLLLFSSLIGSAFASDYHQSGQNHSVTYTVTDSSGNPVSGQSVGLALYRVSDSTYYDFGDATFKGSSWTTRTVLMSYNSTDGYYYRIISVDNGGIISGEYIAIVSNDDATYGDTQAESFEYERLDKMIRIQR